MQNFGKLQQTLWKLTTNYTGLWRYVISSKMTQSVRFICNSPSPVHAEFSHISQVMLGLAIYENIDKEGDMLMFYSIVED